MLRNIIFHCVLVQTGLRIEDNSGGFSKPSGLRIHPWSTPFRLSSVGLKTLSESLEFNQQKEVVKIIDKINGFFLMRVQRGRGGLGDLGIATQGDGFILNRDLLMLRFFDTESFQWLLNYFYLIFNTFLIVFTYIFHDFYQCLS